MKKIDFIGHYFVDPRFLGRRLAIVIVNVFHSKLFVIYNVSNVFLIYKIDSDLVGLNNYYVIITIKTVGRKNPLQENTQDGGCEKTGKSCR
jgi:hypothetical protein